MKNQSGRSMIEMLGVLAIIGVLSLGGVAVFNAAMNRHTANNLTYDVMLMAESTVSLGPQEQMPFDASTKYDQMSSVLVGGVANVIVNDVDKEICDILISKGGNGVFVLENQADGSPLTDCADDGMDIVFAFRDGYLPGQGFATRLAKPAIFVRTDNVVQSVYRNMLVRLSRQRPVPASLRQQNLTTNRVV